MIRIRHNKSRVAARLRRKARRTDLVGTERDVRRSIVDANSALRFDPHHAETILRVRAGRGRMGSESVSYARLLSFPKDEVGAIWKQHIVGDD